MSGNEKRWQQTFSGKVLDPLRPTLESVSYEDIAHGLAQKIRFNGQAEKMGYTVAQHCVLGAKALHAQMHDPDLALAFLLHELGEVYLPDVPSPLKPYLTVHPDEDWCDLEARHSEVLLEKIGHSRLLPAINGPEVARADVRMLLTEKRDLLGPEPKPWGFDEKPYGFKITDIWDPMWAEERWNRAYTALTKGGTF